MNEFEKVEKLVQKANVSYEDAKKALEEANGDMLDAMIALEKEGKVNGPSHTTYSTNTQQQSIYRDVPTVIEQSNQQKEGKSFFKDLGAAIKRGFQYTVDNSVKVVKNGQEIIKLPLWISIILMLAAWELLLIVIIISLFLDCRYSIVGKDDTNEVNRVMDQASQFAGKVKESWNESFGSEQAAHATDNTQAAPTAENTQTTVVEGTVEDNNA